MFRVHFCVIFVYFSVELPTLHPSLCLHKTCMHAIHTSKVQGALFIVHLCIILYHAMFKESTIWMSKSTISNHEASKL